MITTIGLQSLVYKIIKASNFKSVLNGDVYMGSRPLNSLKNDVVIGSLNLPDGTVMPGTIIVNIFAKDIQNGTSFFPDLKTMENAAKIITPLFDDVYFPEHSTNIDIESQRDYKIDGAQEWAYVIRLKTRTIKKN